MPAVTPDLAAQHTALAALDSRYVDAAALPWRATRWPTIQAKMLMEDKERGRSIPSSCSSAAETGSRASRWASGPVNVRAGSVSFDTGFLRARAFLPTRTRRADIDDAYLAR